MCWAQQPLRNAPTNTNLLHYNPHRLTCTVCATVEKLQCIFSLYRNHLNTVWSRNYCCMQYTVIQGIRCRIIVSHLYVTCYKILRCVLQDRVFGLHLINCQMCTSDLQYVRNFSTLFALFPKIILWHHVAGNMFIYC